MKLALGGSSFTENRKTCWRVARAACGTSRPRTAASTRAGTSSSATAYQHRERHQAAYHEMAAARPRFADGEMARSMSDSIIYYAPWRQSPISTAAEEKS